MNGAKIHDGQFETLEVFYQIDRTEICAGTLKVHVVYKESDKLRGTSLVDRMRMPNREFPQRGECALRPELLRITKQGRLVA